MYAATPFVAIIVALFALGFLQWRRRAQGTNLEPVSVLSGKGELPAWLTLPPWPKGPRDIEIHSHSRDIFHHVNLENNTCSCERWVETCKAFPANDLRRICRHVAQAVVSSQREYGVTWNSWTLEILESMSRGASHGVCARFEAARFSNGEQEFLAIYNCATGYTDLYGDRGGFFGYLGRSNRWAWGEGPENPLVLKKTLRPWIAMLDLKHRAFQEEYARKERERRERELAALSDRKRSDNEAAQFPLDLLPNAYRKQDFDRIHPGWIHFKEPVTAHVEVASRTLNDETRRIVASVKGLAPFEDEGDGFCHLRVDGKDLLIRLEHGRQTVRVVFQRDLKRLVDYSHESFSPGECRWGREGTAPPRLLFVRGLIYDFLHGLPLEGDRLDFELSQQPYMPEWEKFKAHPLDRAPYPPLP
jgi:hypothetical protein